MLSTSACLALVLHCASSLHPVPLNPVAEPQILANPDAYGVVGRVLPRVLQMDRAGLTIKARGEEGSAQDQTRSIRLYLAEADLNTIVPGLGGNASGVVPGSSQAAAPPVQPTYESWDVLRQYPRYTLPSQPSIPAPKSQETPKNVKDHNDA